MADLPDFAPKRTTLNYPTWRSAEEAVWIWLLSVTGLAAGVAVQDRFYTIPEGRKCFSTDVNMGANFRGWARFWYYDGANVWQSHFSAYNPAPYGLVIPRAGFPGKDLTYYLENEDIVTGDARMVWGNFWLPASEPQKAKNDDPEEVFKAGEFTTCNVHNSLDGALHYLFYSPQKKKDYYLKIRDYGAPRQKTLQAFPLKPEGASEIKHAIDTKAKNLEQIIKKHEKEFKLWRKKG